VPATVDPWPARPAGGKVLASLLKAETRNHANAITRARGRRKKGFFYNLNVRSHGRAPVGRRIAWHSLARPGALRG